ncbi:unnamed protein product [Musa banksii]
MSETPFLRARSSSARATVGSPYPVSESTPTSSSSGHRVLGLRIPHRSGGPGEAADPRHFVLMVWPTFSHACALFIRSVAILVQCFHAVFLVLGMISFSYFLLRSFRYAGNSRETTSSRYFHLIVKEITI